jgi:hypothetical protein
LEAAKDYLAGIQESLNKGEVFSAAYYLKELSLGAFWKELFLRALAHAAEEKDLWWQVRALQELGWEKELKALLLEHEDEVNNSRNPILEVLLARAKNDDQRAIDLTKQIARSMRDLGGGIIGLSKDAKA